MADGHVPDQMLDEAIVASLREHLVFTFPWKCRRNTQSILDTSQIKGQPFQPTFECADGQRQPQPGPKVGAEVGQIEIHFRGNNPSYLNNSRKPSFKGISGCQPVSCRSLAISARCTSLSAWRKRD